MHYQAGNQTRRGRGGRIAWTWPLPPSLGRSVDRHRGHFYSSARPEHFQGSLRLYQSPLYSPHLVDACFRRMASLSSFPAHLHTIYRKRDMGTIAAEIAAAAKRGSLRLLCRLNPNSIRDFVFPLSSPKSPLFCSSCQMPFSSLHSFFVFPATVGSGLRRPGDSAIDVD